MASKSRGNSGRYAARRRGADFEKRLAALMGGTVYHGQAGDVDYKEFTVEAKYVTGLIRLGDLPNFIEQAKRNSANRGKPWLLAMTGGKTFNNAEVYVLAPLSTWLSKSEEVEDINRSDAFVRLEQAIDDIESLLTLKDSESDSDA